MSTPFIQANTSSDRYKVGGYVIAPEENARALAQLNVPLQGSKLARASRREVIAHSTQS